MRAYRSRWRRRPLRSEVAGKHAVVALAEQEDQVAVYLVIVLSLRIEHEIAVDVEIDRAQGKRANFRPAIDREAAMELAAMCTVAGGEDWRRLVGHVVTIKRALGTDSPSSGLPAGSVMLSETQSEYRSSGNGRSKTNSTMAVSGRSVVGNRGERHIHIDDRDEAVWSPRRE